MSNSLVQKQPRNLGLAFAAASPLEQEFERTINSISCLFEQGGDCFAHTDAHQTYGAQPFQDCDISPYQHSLFFHSVQTFFINQDFCQIFLSQLSKKMRQLMPTAYRFLPPFLLALSNNILPPRTNATKFLHRHRSFHEIILL